MADSTEEKNFGTFVIGKSAIAMAGMIQRREISSVELVKAHLEQIGRVNPVINAVTRLLAGSALQEAEAADAQLTAGKPCGPLHGVPFSIKDSIDVAGETTTAGTTGRKTAAAAKQDATVVARLRKAGAIPLAKTNLPELLFAFESDNFIFGRTNNPHDLSRTAGGSSGGEAALIAACGSPLGLGSDAAGSVRLPAHFCGIASIKPTSGRLPRTGHVPPPSGWIERLWQIGPMARHVEDLVLSMEILAGEDGRDFTTAPVPLAYAQGSGSRRIAFFIDNGIAECTGEIKEAVKRCAKFLDESGMVVEEKQPPGIEQSYELEMALLGVDAGEGIETYLRSGGSAEWHPLLEAWLARLRPLRRSATEFAALWGQWDRFRRDLYEFFQSYDAVICPVYTRPALPHRESVKPGNFEGFSYTMAWNLAGYPAATVCCGGVNGLPINVQVVTKPWRDLLALEICALIESGFEEFDS